MSYILALDQGTSSSRAIIYDSQGQMVGHAQNGFDMIFPQEGWVEQDPEVIWQTTLESARQALVSSGIGAAEILAVGITNQRETTLVWDRASGTCVYNAIVWQDSRTAEACERNKAEVLHGQRVPDVISQATGLLVDPYFSSTKIAWILDNVPGVRSRAERGELCFGTVDSFLIWRLTQGQSHVTDATNASRTQLFNIHSQLWSPQLVDFYNIPMNMLPQVLDSVADFGTVAAELLGAAIPIRGVAGDQQAALIGQGCVTLGQAKSTYGTGCFVMAHTGAEAISSKQNLLSTIAYRIAGKVSYALEGSIFVAGVGVKWLKDTAALIDSPAQTSADFASTGGDTGGVYFVPAFTGLGAPYWRPDAKGLITGLTLDSGRAEIVTALVQGVVFQTEELIRAMAADGAIISQLRVDGGMVVNDHLCQFLADILNIEVLRPRNIETTALGAGVLAGIGAGLFAGLAEAAAAWQLDRKFSAQMSAERRAALLSGYSRAVRQVLMTE